MPEISEASKWLMHNKDQLEKSSRAGCYFCEMIFDPSEITEWVDDNDTALCPRCGIDSVLGSASGYDLSLETLSNLHRYWFEGRSKI